MRLRIILLFGLFLAFQSESRAAAACSGAEYHQFDFWLGDWEVFDPQGKKVGENRIESINAGCALLENWSGASGVLGKSLNIYDASDRRWHQFWVDSSGSSLTLVGGWMDEKMILSGSEVDSKTHATVRQRITWSRNPDGSVRQLWETSAGQAWTVAFDGKYVRKRSN